MLISEFKMEKQTVHVFQHQIIADLLVKVEDVTDLDSMLEKRGIETSDETKHYLDKFRTGEMINVKIMITASSHGFSSSETLSDCHLSLLDREAETTDFKEKIISILHFHGLIDDVLLTLAEEIEGAF